MPPPRSFREHLQEGILLFDGGVGTLLYDKGVFLSRSFEELNLSSPALVKSVHAEYIRAGAEVIETNTFGANAVKLEAHGARENLSAINYRGAKLAREAAGDRAWVAGSIGPLGIKIEPWGPTSVDEAKGLFREQAQALLEGGVDLFVLETFSDINEIRQAMAAVRELSPDAFLVAQMTLGEDGNSLYGTAPEVFAQRLEQWGADAIGVNCSVGPAVMLDAVERLVRISRKPTSVMPNAGLPRSVDGRAIYLASPDYMSSYARRFADAGARIIGGCCGTTPLHIRAMRDAIRASAVDPKISKSRIALTAAPPEAAPARSGREAQSRLTAGLAAGRFLRAVQLSPPRGLAVAELVEGVRALAATGVDFVVVEEGSRTSARMSAEALAVLLERETGVETVLRFGCRDRNLLGMQGALLGAHALGLRNLVCETGDALTPVDFQHATVVFDVDSIGLANMVRRLNQGYDVGGNPIGPPTCWHPGVAANPAAINLDEEVRRFEWKVDAGAEYAITAPVYDLGRLDEFLERIRHCRIPVLLGLRPLLSQQDAEFLGNEVPGCLVPDEIVERMRKASGRSEASAVEEGLAIARELAIAAASRVDGLVVSVPARQPELARAVLDGIDPARA